MLIGTILRRHYPRPRLQWFQLPVALTEDSADPELIVSFGVNDDLRDPSYVLYGQASSPLF
jgi:hypothetical protein